jgi:serine phosphatase RsbU (regulator of sigma subunit)
MVDTRAILRDSIRLSSSPGAILEHANDMLCSEIPTSMFVTCLVAILEPGRGRLQFANAGQNLPLRSIDGRIQELRATGMPLGIMQGAHYEENETIIEPGESILFYSDGLVEAHNSSRDMFGDELLKEIVSNHTINPQSLINTLLSEMVEFTGQENEQEDDVTLVALYHSDGFVNRN